MLRVLALLSLLLPLFAEDKWTFVRSGPFEVWTDGSDKAARVRLVEAEQFRHALGQILGKDDLKSVWKIRILATKNRRRMPLQRVRDLWITSVALDEPLSSEFRRALGRVLIDSNARAFPVDVDQGMLDLLAPLEVQGTRLHLGVPESRDAGWARAHLFLTDPVLAGRARVFYSALESGGDVATAGRNAFEKPQAEIDKMIAAHLKQGDWPVKDLPGRAMSDKDFAVRTVSSELVALTRADLGEAKYQDLTSADGYESAGDVAKACEAGSKSATAWLAAGVAKKDSAMIAKAAELNPLWGEPHAALARLGGGLTEWQKAAQLDLRNVAYWQAYAEAATVANNFKDAGKAWNGAFRATASEEERVRLRAARAKLEETKADYSVSERQRERDDRAKELERVKSESMAGIHDAEAKANARLNEGKAPVAGKVEDWWDGPGGTKQSVTGMLQRVDCGKTSKLVLKTADSKLLTLAVGDPTKIVILNSKEQTLGCGVQNPARRVTVEHQSGRLLTIEFK